MTPKLLVAAALAVATFQAGATDVGVSVQISQPGVYGRIDIGRFPQPQLVVAQPVIISQPQVIVARPVQPVYLWVPKDHRKNWRRYCGQYGACASPVVFVRHDWYQGHVMPYADDGHRHGQGNGYGKSNGKGKGHGKGKHDD